MKTIVLLMCFILSSCAKVPAVDNFLLGEDNVAEPAPLIELAEEENAELEIETVWSQQLGKTQADQQANVVLAADSDQIVALDPKGLVVSFQADTGDVLWKRPIKRSKIVSGPVLGYGMVLVVTDAPELIALDETTGRVLWKVALPNDVLALPTIAGQKILIKTIDDSVFALSTATGKTLWEYDHDMTVLTLQTNSAVQVMGDIAVAGFADGRLAILSLKTGDVFWKRRITEAQGRTAIERMIGIVSDPILTPNVMYIATYQGFVNALQMQTGEKLWQRKISAYHNMKLYGSYLFVSDTDSYLWALDQNTGKVLWKQDKLSARKITSPVIFDNHLVVGDYDGYLHWLSLKDGQILAQIRVDKSQITATPIVQNDKLYVLTRRGKLICYKLN